MSYAIIIANFAAIAGLLVTVFLGYALATAVGVPGSAGIEPPVFVRHVVVALSSTVLAIFGQSMTLVYFMGTSRAVARAVAVHGLDSAYASRAHALKRQALPSSALALLLVMVAFVAGGGAASGAVAPPIHHLAAWLALLTHGLASLDGARMIGGVMGLLVELDTLIEQRGDAART